MHTHLSLKDNSMHAYSGKVFYKQVMNTTNTSNYIYYYNIIIYIINNYIHDNYSLRVSLFPLPIWICPYARNTLLKGKY